MRLDLATGGAGEDGNMFQRVILSAIVIVCCGNAQFAQVSAPSGSADQLQPIARRLIQDYQDLVDRAHSEKGDCQTMLASGELRTTTNSAIDQVQAAQLMLKIYSLISTAIDRAQVRGIVASEVPRYRQQLDLNIKSLNLTLGLPSIPAGAAVVGTRVRDDIRAAIAILEHTELQ